MNDDDDEEIAVDVGCTQAAWQYAKNYDQVNGGDTMRKKMQNGRLSSNICQKICDQPRKFGVNPELCVSYNISRRHY